MVEVLPVLGEPAASVQPPDGTFDDPTLGQDDEAFDLIGTPDDLDFESR